MTALRDVLLNSGISASVKADLRFKIIEHLQRASKLNLGSKARPQSLERTAILSIIADYLKQEQLQYTLSVFLAETSNFQVLDKQGISKVLGLSLSVPSSSSLLETIVSNKNDQTSPGTAKREARLLRGEETLKEAEKLFEAWKAKEISRLAERF